MRSEEDDCFVLLEIVKWVKEKGYNEICFRSDSKNAISFLNDSIDQISWFDHSIVEDCLFLLSDFSYAKTAYVSRNFNGWVDKVVKYNRNFNVSYEWLDNNFQLGLTHM